MPDSYGQAFAGMVAFVAGEVIDAEGKAKLNANLDKLLALIPNPGVVPAVGFDAKRAGLVGFDQIAPEQAVKLRKELEQMRTLWNAAPAA